jgi:ribonuclease-3
LIRSSDSLCKKLNYQFKNQKYLKQALTHRSAGKSNNERLEFLGDGALNFIIAEDLFRRFPEAREGELSRLRASLVKGEKLSELAADLDLGEYLHLGPGELKSGGFRRASILADALEAIFGAIYLDAGFDVIKNIILSIYDDSLNAIDREKNYKDPKTRLQEYLQSQQLSLPEYNVVSITGEAHDQTFKVSCKVPGLKDEVIGEGSSRRKAEQDAADCTLKILSHE